MKRLAPWLVFTLACEVETIVAATDQRAVAEDGGSVESACRSADDCQGDEYCAKDACDALIGRCETRPTLCDAIAEPVCGCDGITYFSDCLRRSSGAVLAYAQQCDRSGARCGGPPGVPCPEGAACAMFGPPGPFCDGQAPGMCWVLPSVCDTSTTGGDRFRSCDPGAPRCLDLCSAIRTELPFSREDRCDMRSNEEQSFE